MVNRMTGVCGRRAEEAYEVYRRTINQHFRKVNRDVHRHLSKPQPAERTRPHNRSPSGASSPKRSTLIEAPTDTTPTVTLGQHKASYVAPSPHRVADADKQDPQGLVDTVPTVETSAADDDNVSVVRSSSSYSSSSASSSSSSSNSSTRSPLPPTRDISLPAG